MILCVAGSRDYEPSLAEIENALEFFGHPMTTLVSGMCRGVDLTVVQYADILKIPVQKFPVTREQWKTIGKSAGPNRNRAMAEVSDALLVIGPHTGKGTSNCIEEFHRLGKPVYVHQLRSIIQ